MNELIEIGTTVLVNQVGHFLATLDLVRDLSEGRKQFDPARRIYRRIREEIKFKPENFDGGHQALKVIGHNPR